MLANDSERYRNIPSDSASQAMLSFSLPSAPGQGLVTLLIVNSALLLPLAPILV